ncbi:MAG: metal-dependent hydrolase, partial [Planctomycetes bacterium]|nr:metal-dependent hydrolase [Planctomycetota bacterium]
MAGYREHISVSGLCGVCYGLTATWMLGFRPVQAALAGCLTWVAGMLPDLDSDSGKPVREIFALLAAVAPLVLMRRLEEWSGGDLEAAVLAAIVLYAAIRYGASALLKTVSVHRGMFHSIPAMLIFGL